MGLRTSTVVTVSVLAWTGVTKKSSFVFPQTAILSAVSRNPAGTSAVGINQPACRHHQSSSRCNPGHAIKRAAVEPRTAILRIPNAYVQRPKIPSQPQT